MFLVRSAFWLTVAFLVMRPAFDVQNAAKSLAHATVETGQAIAGEQIRNHACASLECIGGKAVLSAALASATTALAPPQKPADANPVPLPRPRPH